MEINSDNDSKDPVICNHLWHHWAGTERHQNPIKYKKETQAISNALEGEVSIMHQSYMKYLILLYRTCSLSFNEVSPATMAKAQTKDSILGLVIQYVHKGDKPKGSMISKIKCKAVQKYLLQFIWLVMKQGVLHWIYLSSDVESH